MVAIREGFTEYVAPPRGVAQEAVDAQIVAWMRCLLGMSGLAIIYVDPTEPARYVELTYTSLVVYSGWSVILFLVASRPPFATIIRFAPWIDVAWASYLVALTQGTSSIFFFLYVFAIMVASFTRGYREGFLITAVSTTLFVVVGFRFAPLGDDFELNRSLIRTIYLFTLGWMIAYWGGREIRLRRRLTALREVGNQWNPRVGVVRTIGANLERVIDFFDAPDCVLVVKPAREGAASRVYRATAGREPRVAAPQEIPAEAENPMLELPPGLQACFDAVDPEAASGIAPSGGRIAALLDMPCFATVDYRQIDGATGRLFLRCPDGPLAADDLEFLAQLVSAIARVAENTQLTEELVLKAAEHERFRISLDIHDTTVQPYIGLKLGLDALQREAGDRNPLSRRIGDLVDMASMTIRDLRGYATALRESAPMSGPALVHAVREQAGHFHRLYGIEVDVRMDPDPRMTGHIAAEVFRLIAEGLSNVLRHTSSRRAFVHLENHDDRLELAVGNEATAGSTPPRSFIPRSISERARLLGGTSRVENLPGGHTVVRVTIPTT